jgi:predicted metal-dependent phosphotriesterase family hydrolase
MARAGKVQTVTGLIDPAALGRVLMHEHVLCDITPPALKAKNDPGPEITLKTVWAISYGRLKSACNCDLHLKEVAGNELALMKSAGAGTVVELTCGGLRPDPSGLADIARATGRLGRVLINRRGFRRASCPLIPQQRRRSGHRIASEKGQKRTPATHRCNFHSGPEADAASL